MANALIIDDNSSWLKTLIRLVSGFNYTIYTAGSFQEALGKIRNTSFDLVVTDIRLVDEDITNIDGIDLLRILYKEGRLKNAIVVTGYPDLVTKKAAEDLGAIYLEKGSFSITDFRDILKKFEMSSISETIFDLPSKFIISGRQKTILV